jgi:hypothetical protein
MDRQLKIGRVVEVRGCTKIEDYPNLLLSAFGSRWGHSTSGTSVVLYQDLHHRAR